MILLPNEMFDDGGVECKNFVIGLSEDYYDCEWNYIEGHFDKTIQNAIVNAINLGQRYITLHNHMLNGVMESIIEISWD